MKKVFRKTFSYLKEVYLCFKKHETLILAADISFCGILSFVPILMIGVAVTGYILGGTDDVYQKLLASLIDILPFEVDIILANLQDIVENWQNLGLWGMFLLFFISTILFTAVENALDKIFHTQKRRNFLHSRFLAIGLIVLFSILFFLPTLSQVLEIALHQFGFEFPLSSWVQADIYHPVFTFFAYLMLVTIVPNKKVERRFALIGGLVFTFGIAVMSQYFAWYMSYAFSQYNIIYGSLTALILVLLWVYYVAIIFLIATYFVSVLHRSTKANL